MSNCLCDAWLLVPHSLCYHLLAKAAYKCWFSSSFSPLSLFSINYHNELERHREELGCKMYAQTSLSTRQLASVTLVTQQCLLAKCQLQVWFRDEKKGAFSFVKNVKINTISTWILIRNRKQMFGEFMKTLHWWYCIFWGSSSLRKYSWPSSVFFGKLWRLP